MEETAERYRRFLNPTLPNLIKFMGYGAMATSPRGMIVTDSAGEEWLGCLALGSRGDAAHTGDHGTRRPLAGENRVPQLNQGILLTNYREDRAVIVLAGGPISSEFATGMVSDL